MDAAKAAAIMKHRVNHLLRLASLALALGAGCDEDPTPAGTDVADATPPGANVPDAAPGANVADAEAPSPPTCAAWIVDVDQQRSPAATQSAVIVPGALVLTAEGDTDAACRSDEAPCAPVKVYQGVLRGDFDVSLTLDALQGEAGAHVELFVTSEHAYYYSVGAGLRLGADGTPLLDVRRRSHPNVASDVVATSATHARLRLRRVDDLLTATAQSGDDVAELGAISLSGDLIVGAAVDQPYAPTRVTAHLGHFQVVGGGGDVRSEDFACPATLAP
jgi:hypothetical protein